MLLSKEEIDKAYQLLPANMNRKPATVLLLAIGLQESRLKHQKQIGGPAHGLLQFERGGGVHGVLTHKASRPHVLQLCLALDLQPTKEALYQALLGDNDILDFALGRLLLWTDSKPLPAVGEVQAAWECYVRNWRPGKPHRHTWDTCYADAIELYRDLFSEVTA